MRTVETILFTIHNRIEVDALLPTVTITIESTFTEGARQTVYSKAKRKVC